MSSVATAPTAPPVPRTPRGRRGLIHPLAWMVLRRLGIGMLTLWAASVLVFMGTVILPGSPATAVLGRQASPEAVAAIEHTLGYDKPLLVQYGTWLFNVVRGDFGFSAVAAAQGQTTAVSELIATPLFNTFCLAAATVALLLPLSMFLGVLAGVRANRWQDHLVSTASLIAVSLPEFVVGAILVAVFFVGLDVFPPLSLLPPGESPLLNPTLLALPVLTLLLTSVGWTVRLLRAGTIEVLKADYVQMARLNGIRERRILRRYVLRNALAPSVQIFALSIQYLFGGVIVAEAVFQYPGIGTQIVNAVNSHDNTQVQAIALILAAIYILINIAADLAVVLLVPKLRTEA
ncbi:ABC transporter permease [Rhodococcus sp. NPDC060176]|uniref:ABC transporter permease n=1 Tax=Rhodococcus sp. NPDC060176 TaxID=3347062 RepID=UPI0036508CD8